MAISGRVRALTKRPRFLEVQARNALEEVKEFMDDRLERAYDVMTTYPDPKPGSRYVRTNDYKSHWKVTPAHETQDGLIGTLHNNLRYAVYVGGDETGQGQQEQHDETGWPLLSQAIDRPTYRRGLQSVVRKALGE